MAAVPLLVNRSCEKYIHVALTWSITQDFDQILTRFRGQFLFLTNSRDSFSRTERKSCFSINYVSLKSTYFQFVLIY